MLEVIGSLMFFKRFKGSARGGCEKEWVRG